MIVAVHSTASTTSGAELGARRSFFEHQPGIACVIVFPHRTALPETLHADHPVLDLTAPAASP